MTLMSATPGDEDATKVSRGQNSEFGNVLRMKEPVPEGQSSGVIKTRRDSFWMRSPERYIFYL